MVLALVAGPVLASNTGFKLNYPMKKGGKNLISLPYFYYPDGNINAPAWNNAACTPATPGADCEDSKKACTDLATGGCVVVGITKYNRTAQGTLTPKLFSCGSGFGQFVLKPGEAYFVNVSADCTADEVGSHDDTYSVGKGGTAKVSLLNGNNNVSVPYHVKAIDSKELCEHVTLDNAGVGLKSVVRINQTTGQPTTFSCGSTFGMYPIVAGAGYFLVPNNLASPATYDIQFRTY